jgi:small subunit ribosomal protein S5
MTDEVKSSEEKKVAAEKPKVARAPKAPAKKAEAAQPVLPVGEEAEVEEKLEEEIMPEAPVEVVDEAEDEKELLEKLKKDAVKERKSKPGVYGEDTAEYVWVPKTNLGRKVYNGEIKSMHEIMSQSIPIKEVGLVDKLLPGMQEEVLDVGRVQRVTDSGRRMRFRVVAAVGNGDGYIGVGEAKGKEAGPTIRKSIERAKLNMVEIKRGCGSWECGCGTPHTVPFKISGKSGSVNVTLMPAPRGVGIVSGTVAKTMLTLAGLKDVWVMTEGHTRSGINFAHAIVNALENTNYVKLKAGEAEKLRIVTGAANPQPQPPQEEVAE